MMVSQSIHRPTGINVFGSFVLRVEPDVALVSFKVWRTDDKAAAAFAAAREALSEVRAYLDEAKVPPAEIQSSHVRLSDEREHRDNRWVHVGYRASVGLAVRITEFPRFEELVAGVVGAGANEIENTEFATTRLAEYRAEARRGAFGAARRKAELYAKEADIRVGDVLHIEDVNPDSLRRRESHGMDIDLSADDAAARAVAPGSINVNAAVMVSFAIDRGKRTSGFG
ncbi:MAG: SIMPL domain-containing protein [Myxococcota bacterium]